MSCVRGVCLMSGSVLCSCCLSDVWKCPVFVVFVKCLEVSCVNGVCLMSGSVLCSWCLSDVWKCPVFV